MDDLHLRRVHLSFPRKSNDFCKNRTELETWITMLEQMLTCNYNNYTISVTTDSSQRRTEVEIIFATVDDAVWFKMRYLD